MNLGDLLEIVEVSLPEIEAPAEAPAEEVPVEVGV
jgi:hypothetical protein